jgi:hypothetical protein
VHEKVMLRYRNLLDQVEHWPDQWPQPVKGGKRCISDIEKERKGDGPFLGHQYDNVNWLRIVTK